MKKLCMFLLTFFSINNNLFAPKETFFAKEESVIQGKLTTRQFQVLQILKLIWDTEEEFCQELIGIGSASALSQLAFSQGMDESFYYPDNPTTVDPDNSYKVETTIRDVLQISCGRINKAIIDYRKPRGLVCPDWRMVATIFLCYIIEKSKTLELQALENPLFTGTCRAMNVIFSRIIGGFFCTQTQDPAHKCKMDDCIERAEPLNEETAKTLLIYFDPTKSYEGDPNDYLILNGLWNFQRLFRDRPQEAFETFRPNKNNQPKL